MTENAHHKARTHLSMTTLRATKHRIAVLSALLASKAPLTHQQLETSLCMDRVTLYRVLESLMAHQVIHRIAGDDRVWRFAAHELPSKSGEADFHPHFHCRQCHRFMCLDQSLSALEALRLPKGFRSYFVNMTIEGQCPACQIENGEAI